VSGRVFAIACIVHTIMLLLSAVGLMVIAAHLDALGGPSVSPSYMDCLWLTLGLHMFVTPFRPTPFRLTPKRKTS
jgi:hypothetical protein